jgi:ferredoxin
MKYRITYDRELCIGEFTCVTQSPDFWAYSEDGKADLNNARFNLQTRRWELVIDEEEYDDFFAAAANCPSGAIAVEELKSGAHTGAWKGAREGKSWHHAPAYDDAAQSE